MAKLLGFKYYRSDRTSNNIKKQYTAKSRINHSIHMI